MNPALNRVAGKTAIVTGGRGDLGGTTAALLAELGAVAASLDVAGVPAAADRSNIRQYDVDVTSEASVADTIRRVRDEVGTPDILVTPPESSAPSAPRTRRPSRILTPSSTSTSRVSG